MEKTLLITNLTWNQKEYLATALYHDKKLLEVSLELQDKHTILHNIYVGRVKNIVKNLNAAFIEIAPGVSCYYDLDELKNPLYVKKINCPRMVQGDEVVVQVVRERSKGKPPKVSTNLNFSGKYLVLTSESTTLSISRKLDAETKKSLKESLNFIREPDCGFIIRTNAAQASAEEIKEEYQILRKEYLNLKENAVHRTVFSCLKKQIPEYLHILRDMKTGQLDSIVTDDAEILGQIRQYLEQFPKQEYILKFYEDPMISLNKIYSLDTRLSEALRERVWLKSGGYLIIQPTEALTVIDVNSGKSIAKKKAQEHYLKINLEAAAEIAWQMRLRNISGIIIVDFIDMKSAEDNELLLRTLRASVREDSVPVQIVDMTKLHLVEITRKKVKKSLAEQLMA